MSQNISIGFIGTGSMGRPMIHELLKKGYSVTVYDKYKSAAESVIAAGAVWADTPKACATDNQVVITCLPLPEDVLENMLGETGALDGMTPGTAWIDTSTTDYHNTLRIAKEAKERGIYSIEGPVSNLSHMGVDFANSSIYCAGDREGYDMSIDILNTITKISFYIGEIGTAQTTKLLTNLLFYGPIAICGDCFAISQQAGIPNHWMWDFVKASKGNSVASEQFMPMLLDGSYDSSCSLEIGVKDMNLTVSLADELRVDLPLGRIINGRYSLAGKVYNQRDGHLKISKLTEDANDIKIRISGFIGPSKYGINKSYVRGDAMVVDKYGRMKPKLPESYAAPSFDPTDQQLALAQTLVDFMEYTNYTLVKEAFDMGIAVGVERDLITDMILWSVGTCWVFENLDGYEPNEASLDKMAAIETDLHIPFIKEILAIWNR
nr:NAD(P)-dependent oxidoreductase [uncultured Amphritea sp.]